MMIYVATYIYHHVGTIWRLLENATTKCKTQQSSYDGVWTVAVVLRDIFANKFSPCNKNKLSSLVFALLIRSCPMHHRALQLKQTASLPLHWKIYCAICFDCDAMYRPCTAFPYITDALYYNILLVQCSELWIVYFSTVPNQLSLHLLDCTSMLVLVHCLCLIWLHCNGERLLKAGKTM